MTRSRTIRWILPIAAVAVAGYFGWQRFHGPDPAAKAEIAQKPAATTRSASVPVSIAPVVKADFPVYLSGLGTVQGLNTVVVRTRVDGQIDKIAFKEGQLVNQGDLLAQIEPIAVIFTAPEDQLPYINEAQSAQPLKVIALTTDGKKTLSDGVLSVVNNQVDTTSGTIRLKAVFDNKNHALWPGQSVSTRLLVRTLKDATVVPDDAIQHGADGLYAYVVNQDNKAELRKIKVSQSIDGRSVVDEGLSPGQQVITAGQYRVQPGALVSTAVASSDAAQIKVTPE